MKLQTGIVAISVVIAACTGDRGTGPLIDDPPAAPPPPQVLKTPDVQVATVGSAFSFDASLNGHAFSDPTGEGLQYVVTLQPHPNGLTVNGAQISGVPVSAMTSVVELHASASNGSTATTRFLLIAFDSALTEPQLPATPYRYHELPPHFKTQFGIARADNTPTNNQPSDAITALGRVLFHDKRLSANDKISCSSCHLQEFGFADTAQFSRGFAGGRTTRQAMALTNVRYYQSNRFFWDERAPSLEALALMPVDNPVEMGLPLDHVVPKLKAAGFYRQLFEEAYGTPAITLDGVSRALAQFLRSLVSYNAPLDQSFDVQAGGAVTFENLTPQERRGMDLFAGDAGCAGCHTSNVQWMTGPRNNGLDAVPTDTGTGAGRFKSPSLRNIEVTGPYMHDGRFKTLEEVVDFYNTGVQETPQLDKVLRERDGSVARLGLTADDRAALVAFLKTLTDRQFLQDERFSDPFPRHSK